MINTASITDLKQNTAQIIKKLKIGGKSVVILQRSQPAAVLVDPNYYAVLEEALENSNDLTAIEERKNEKTVSFEEASKKVNQK
ncbi:MAG: type II toxin-antitoxin system Phd/YefM family antitoxin [bacterium]|nr:type II toxin-antitoxin system Phd/YefM family antitoxin [bacterium]